MADELVEKVARALCQVVARCDDDCEGCDAWPNFKPAAEKLFAAIEQAGFGVRRREPTQEALDALTWDTPDDSKHAKQVYLRGLWRRLYDDPTASPAGANEKGER